MNHLIIRDISPEDLPVVLSLYSSALENEQILSLEEAQSIFQKIQKYPNYKIYVAEQNTAIVGTFALLIMDNLAHFGTPSGIVEDVAVRADLQGMGIGKEMMNFALEQCRLAGCYKMVLSSNLRRKQAHAFYESLGFKKHGFSFLINI
jgi:GNAT superfamily N-acetyltransferase